MIVRGAAVRPSATILRSIECETAIRWSIDDVSRISSSWSSHDRIRDECTVEMTHGRRWPASPSAIAAFVPTISARYMWLWMTSARTSIRCAARMPVAIASSGSSMTVTGMPSFSSLRTALPGESETTETS